MNVALIAHDNKKILMENLCIAYRYILMKHSVFTTGTTGTIIEEASNLSVNKYLSGHLGGKEQICAQLMNNEIDLVIFLKDPSKPSKNKIGSSDLERLCNLHNIPLATNLSTAEILLLALDRGELDWRQLIK